MEGAAVEPQAEPSTPAIAPGHLRVEAVVNVSGGTMLARGEDAVRETLAAAFASQGVSANLVFCPGAEIAARIEAALARAHQGDIDAIVVGGGDGTIRTGAAILAGSGVAFGVLPLGTLNHFARDLGIPTELDGAVAVIASAIVREVDVAEVNGQVFVNNSSVGIYPYMVIDRELEMTRRGWAKWSAMLLALWRVLHRFPVRRLTIYAEGRAESCRTPLLFIGNNQYGLSLFSLGHREALDAGALWLYFAKVRNPLSLLRLALRMCLGRAASEPDLERMKVRSVEVRSRTSRLPVALDGEVEILQPPLRYRSRPGELRVFAPPPAVA